MAENTFFKRMKEDLPDHFWRFLIIGLIIYSFIIVGKVIYDNYEQNKKVSKQREEVADLREEIEGLKLKIAYYKTDTYKEKIARGKLRYALPGENVVAVPYDIKVEEKSGDTDSSAIIKRPNYIYWKIYFFGE